MSEQPVSGQGTASAQLKQVLGEKVKHRAGLAATLAGQQAGALAQAVRQAGEQMRQQGEEGQGKTADKVAQPVQRLSGNLSQYDAATLSLDPKQVKPALTSQLQKAKTQLAAQLGNQVSARTAQAGQSVTTVTAEGGVVGQQLQAQNQQVSALVLDALLEKIEPLSNYLSSADATKMRTDASVLGQKAKTKLSSATGTVTEKQQAAAAKGTQVVKQTASGFQQSPILPALGAVAVAVALAARRGAKSGSKPESAAPAGSETVPTAVPTSDLEELSRAQLQQRAESAGLVADPRMTKHDLIQALRNA